MKLTDAFPSKYLSKEDFPEDEDLVLTINEVKLEEIGQGQDQQTKLVAYFSDHKKVLVLNKTNANSIAKLYGDETEVWEGKRITLFVTEVQFGKDMVEAIRVRSKNPQSKATAPVSDPVRKRKLTDDDDE